MLSEEGVEKIKLSSRQSYVHDIWAMQFFPYGMKEGKHYKLSELAVMERANATGDCKGKAAIPSLPTV